MKTDLVLLSQVGKNVLLLLPLLRVDGARIASSTGIDILLLDDFKLVINDTTHLVRPPRRGES